MNRSRSQGFTLIELLIVVAIIAILAAIAVPNLIEAQVRAKVSRAKADMRTIATALEAYRVDHNAYPPNDGRYNVPPIQITTPTAYLTTSLLTDPFSVREYDPTHGTLAQFYTYTKIVTESEFVEDALNGFTPPIEAIDMQGLNLGAHEKYGKWRLVSNGPDREYASQTVISFDPVLLGSDVANDPTNRTVSWGNIIRTQKIGVATFTK